jgi:hypothetical protein
VYIKRQGLTKTKLIFNGKQRNFGCALIRYTALKGTWVSE